jgi:hypothetical protein
MRLLLFALLCIITLLIIRSVQGGGSRPRTPRKGAEREVPRVPPDDIVDVPFKDLDDAGRKKPEEH